MVGGGFVLFGDVVLFGFDGSGVLGFGCDLLILIVVGLMVDCLLCFFVGAICVCLS